MLYCSLLINIFDISIKKGWLKSLEEDVYYAANTVWILESLRDNKGKVSVYFRLGIKDDTW